MRRKVQRRQRVDYKGNKSVVYYKFDLNRIQIMQGRTDAWIQYEFFNKIGHD
jgi:hypothetical protein